MTKSTRLWRTIHLLYSQKIALDFTDHLSDRQLYCLLMRDILPVYQKKISGPRHFLHWHCLDDNDMDCWLTYYASDDERDLWAEGSENDLPPRESPPVPSTNAPPPTRKHGPIVGPGNCNPGQHSHAALVVPATRSVNPCPYRSFVTNLSFRHA
jgi:hypothetical protein